MSSAICTRYGAWVHMKPLWFTADLIARIPNDFIPKSYLDTLNQAAGGQRRSTVVGRHEHGGAARGARRAESSVRSLRVQTQRHYMRSVTMGSNIAEAAEQTAHSNYLDRKQPHRASYAPAIRRSPRRSDRYGHGLGQSILRGRRSGEFIIRHPPSNLADS